MYCTVPTIQSNLDLSYYFLMPPDKIRCINHDIKYTSTISKILQVTFTFVAEAIQMFAVIFSGRICAFCRKNVSCILRYIILYDNDHIT